MGKSSWCLLLIAILAGSVTSEEGQGNHMDRSNPYGPTDVKIIGVHVVTVGIPYGFVCSAQCSPTCNYTWTMDRQTVHGKELDLLLKGLVKNKILTCEAKNPATGKTEKISRTLSVTEGPSNVKITGPAGLAAGKSTNFSCSAICYPSCTYTWFINGEKKSQQPYVTVNAMSWMNSMTLTCEAQDSVSGLKASSTETLWVAVGPSSPKIVGPDAVAVGVRHRFVCLAYCSPGCSYTWTKDNQTTSGDEIYITVKRLVNFIFISCKVQNTLSGTYITVTKELRVTDPISVSPVSPAPAIANQPYSLKCGGTKAQASIQWKMDYYPLIMTSRVSLSAHNTTLTFSPLLQSDGGLYQCVATEGQIVIQSPGYEVYVNYGPVQTGIIQPGIGPVGRHYFLKLGSQSMLWCSADCYPLCSYTWFLNGKKIATGYSVTFATVTRADLGTLTCVAKNSVTGLSSSAETVLNLPDGPSNITISGPNSVEVGIPSTFECLADCSPPCDYTWTAFGQSMHGRNITLAFSRSVDSEVVTCKARNIITGKTETASETLQVTDHQPCGC